MLSFSCKTELLWQKVGAFLSSSSVLELLGFAAFGLWCAASLQRVGLLTPEDVGISCCKLYQN